ncbi:MAG: squalene/phytoene synthase family protein, partial [Candidatus Bipolaricaulia bacterium]
MDLAGAYRACARVAKREARNFYYAFLSLPIRQRRGVYALYTFCREADDVADGAPSMGAPSASENIFDVLRSDVIPESTGSIDSRREQVARMRERLAKAAAGDPEGGRDLALADAIATFGVDPNDLADVLTGMEMDLTLRRIDTFEDLRTYCYHAASAVGLATLPILNDGVPPTDAMRDAAVELGLGMQ